MARLTFLYFTDPIILFLFLFLPQPQMSGKAASPVGSSDLGGKIMA
jgi:hypothetical protein